MSQEATKAARLISLVQIRGVRLVDVVAKSEIRVASDVENVEIAVDPSAAIPGPVDRGVFYVLASFSLQIIGDGRKTPAVTIDATFELRYTIPEEIEDVSDEELAAFAEGNAIFNAWPYWREFIQSTLVRMNLPPVILPVFRLSDGETHENEVKSQPKKKVATQKR